MLAPGTDGRCPWVEGKGGLVEADQFSGGDSGGELCGWHVLLRDVGPGHPREGLGMMVREDFRSSDVDSHLAD